MSTSRRVSRASVFLRLLTVFLEREKRAGLLTKQVRSGSWGNPRGGAARAAHGRAVPAAGGALGRGLLGALGRGGGARQRSPQPRPSAMRGSRQRDVRERRLAKFRQNVARFRLYRLRSLQENMRFAAFFKIYQIFKLKFLKFGNILQILRHLRNFC